MDVFSCSIYIELFQFVYMQSIAERTKLCILLILTSCTVIAPNLFNLSCLYAGADLAFFQGGGGV